MRFSALPLLAVLTAALTAPLPLTPANATSAPSAVTVRSAASPTDQGVPYSLAVVQGVAGGVVGFGNADTRLYIDVHKQIGPSWGLAMPRNQGVGTYSFPSNGSGDFSVAGIGGGCQAGPGTAVIHDAAWSGGNPVRLSMSLTLPCGQAPGATTFVEIRIGEPAPGGALGMLEGPLDSPQLSTTVGSPVTTTRRFTNAGSGPVTLGAAAIAWSQRTDYPAFAVAADGCTGKTLTPSQTCDVQVTFAPQVSGDDAATLTVPDGRPRPAGASLTGLASPLLDQPSGVKVSGQLKSATVTWQPPAASSTGRSYSTYEVVTVDTAGSPGAVVATVPGNTGGYAFRADITGLDDRTTYRYAVRAVLPSGVGPLSVPVAASTAGRLLLYAAQRSDPRQGVQSLSIDPSGTPLLRFADTGTTDHLALSPDTSLLAASDRVWNGSVETCDVRVMSRTGTSVPVEVPRPTANTCDTFPTFTSSSTIVFSRTDDLAVSTVPSLVSYDLTTSKVTAVMGGAGLTQPAAAADGSLVAVDPVADQLVRLAAGTATTIAGTTGARQPAVASTGRIAYVTKQAGSTSDLVSTAADGSDSRTLTANNGSGRAVEPSFTADGTTVYYSQASDVWRVPVTGGVPVSVTQTSSTYEHAPVVIDVPDVDGPSITSRPALPAFTSALSLDYIVAATDPGPAGSGVASYDARYRTGPAGGALGEPVVPAGWTGAPVPTFPLTLVSGQQYCLAVRATDAAGNVGPWSTEQCTVSDRAAPMLTALSTPAAYSPTNRVTLTFSYGDAGAGVAGYNVRYRTAAPGTGFGGYVTTGTLGTASFALSLSPGYSYCLGVRGTDRVGNSSGYSAERCTIAALDDRALASSGTVSRLTSTAYHAGTITQLRATGAKLSYAKVSTTRVGVLVRMCSTCGPVEVYVNGVRIATLSTYSATTRNQVLVWTGRSATRVGPLVLRQSTSKVVYVDGVVFQHS